MLKQMGETPKGDTMSGYNWFSKSNNAIAAEANGRFPASECAKRLGVPVEFVRAQGSSEWHHTSKQYNCTEFFDLDSIREHLETDEGLAQLDAIKSKLKAKKTANEAVHAPADVKWLEWGGTRNHPKATKMSASGATVTDRGGKFVEVKLASGQTFRKGRDTRGFEVSVNGKRVIG
jgi:hypothetical protein